MQQTASAEIPLFAILRVFGIRTAPVMVNGSGGWAIACAALALGLIGDLLLRAWPWGINATLWIAALCVVAAVLPRFDALGLRRERSGTIWLCAALAFSLTLAWRASPVLQTINLITVFLCLGMVSFRTTARAIRVAGTTEYAANFVVSAAQTIAGAAMLLARHLDWRSISAPGRSGRIAAVGRGLAIAALPLILFATLFASADIYFRDLLRDLTLVSPAELFSHLALWALFAWLAGSYLWGALLAERDPVPETPRLSWLRFEFIETAVVFGLIDALFLLFVGVQFRYFFGGADRVESSASLTYAEYARRGFFELVAVAALVVPFLLLTHWLLPRTQARLHRFYGFVAALLIVLVFVVMASALERMRLYQETFGLTELRLYTTAFMIWLFAVFVWLAWTVLRGQRERFPFGILIAGFAVLVGLNALNPDGFIVRRKAAIEGERPFDAAYALSLSADSVPSLVANIEKVPAAERCDVARALVRRYDGSNDNWRSWSWGRSRAERAVSSSDELTLGCTLGGADEYGTPTPEHRFVTTSAANWHASQRHVPP